MHPPLGEAPGSKTETEKKSMVDQVTTMASKTVGSITSSFSKFTNNKDKKEENGTTANGSNSKRDKLTESVSTKLTERFCVLDSFFEDGKTQVDLDDNYMTKSKQVLDENAMKLKKEILVLENEKEEMQDNIKDMNDFIAKNRDVEVTKDNVDTFVSKKDEDADAESMLDDIKAKENAIEDTIDMCKKMYR